LDGNDVGHQNGGGGAVRDDLIDKGDQAVLCVSGCFFITHDVITADHQQDYIRFIGRQPSIDLRGNLVDRPTAMAIVSQLVCSLQRRGRVGGVAADKLDVATRFFEIGIKLVTVATGSQVCTRVAVGNGIAKRADFQRGGWWRIGSVENTDVVDERSFIFRAIGKL
jgi:hypothetical protein